jgi:hypothetical protein
LLRRLLLLLLLPASVSTLLALLLLLMVMLLLRKPLLVKLPLRTLNGSRAQHSFNKSAQSILMIFLLLLLFSMCTLRTAVKPLLLFIACANSCLVSFGRWQCCCDFCCSAAIADHG